METSNSETPKQRINPSRDEAVDQLEDVVLQSFPRLGLQDEDHGASSSSIIIEKDGQQRFPEAAQGSSSGTQWLSRNSVSKNKNIWGYSFFFHGGESSGTRESAVSNKHDYKDEDLKDVPNHYKFKEIENRTPDHRNPYDLTTNSGPRYGHCWWNELLAEQHIQETLRGEQCLQKERLINELLRFVFTLMTNKLMHSIFQALLDACEEGNHMDSLVWMIWSDKESFLNAAFCQQGVHSIVKLIRKLKKSPQSFTVTAILSTRFVELMTHSIAKEVVHQCFILFRREANEILYERAITYFHYLATHKVGCRALNDCMRTISGEQRSRLLDAIAGVADILCDEHYGNYVLQNAMELNHGNVNRKIIDCLRGKFIQLSLRKVGSNCVEKCMEISEGCTVTVIEEILQSPGAPRVLAEDEYGNYVIQKALRLTRPSKENPVHQGFTNLHNSLMNSLRPHLSAIAKTKYGKMVIDALKSTRPT